MSDVVDKEQPEEGATEESKDVIDPKVQALIDSVIAEKQKEWQSEVDRRVTKHVNKSNELEIKLENFKKAQMEESEREKYELEQAKKQKEELANEKRNLELGIAKIKIINELQLPAKFEKFIVGNTEDDIISSAKELKSVMDSNITDSVQRQVKEALGSGKKPITTDVNKIVYRDGMTTAEINANWDKPGFKESLAMAKKT